MVSGWLMRTPQREDPGGREAGRLFVRPTARRTRPWASPDGDGDSALLGGKKAISG